MTDDNGIGQKWEDSVDMGHVGEAMSFFQSAVNVSKMRSLSPAVVILAIIYVLASIMASQADSTKSPDQTFETVVAILKRAFFRCQR